MTQKGKDQGLFQRGDVWGIRYVDENGREHREMVSAAGVAPRCWPRSPASTTPSGRP